MLVNPRVRGTGFVRDYLDYVSVHEAPESYHLASLLALFSAALDRKLVIMRGYTIRANVFALLYGPPASRKTYTTRITRQIFTDVGLELPVVGENATDEGILQAMVNRVDEGLSPSAVIIAEEFGTLLGGKKYQEGLGRFLMRAYDGEKLVNTRKKKSYGVGDSFVTLLAGTTPEDMKMIPEHVLRTGFASRMWIINEPGKARRVWRPRFDRSKRKELASKLEANISRFAKEEVVMFDPGREADDTFSKWYMGPAAEFEASVDAKVSYWVGRRHEHAVKAAVLLHLLDGGGFEGMSADAARRGLEFVESMEPGLFEAHGSLMATKWGKLWDQLTELVRARGRIQQRHVMGPLAKWAETAGEANMALRMLKDSGLVRVEGDGGKAVLVWIDSKQEAG